MKLPTSHNIIIIIVVTVDCDIESFRNAKQTLNVPKLMRYLLIFIPLPFFPPPFLLLHRDIVDWHDFFYFKIKFQFKLKLTSLKHKRVCTHEYH